MPATQKIIHIDMDCFYASIELRDNPHLRGKPVAVGGGADQRGVLSTCNYEARKFGLHSAMPTAQALKFCPNLILLPVNMALYKQVSQQIQQIFYRYTHLVEPLSLDEAYLDVTDCDKCSGSATWIAQEIRQKIWQETQLTASAGVAPLKFLTKIASDKNKPNGQFVIHPDEVAEFVRKLPLSAIPGVGKVTTQRLLEMGLKTCADVQSFEQHLLLNQLGKVGQRIWSFSHGIDERKVQPERLRKSVGVETTLLQNITELRDGEAVLDHLYPQLIERVLRACPHISLEKLNKIGIKLKFEDFQITTLEKSAVSFQHENFRALLSQIWQRRQDKSIRLIGLHVNLPEQQEEKQMSLWEN
ncbi:DNA polymerase IV [Avibacterium paragallinarum]|uniref:DNA polymerase IV n=1 Tax=Avibacterium paragallinarum TaxID=728 RepID=UPI00397C142B